MQGGTNETVIHGMYQKLNAEGKQGNLKVYWYTAKDQTKPISATAKERNCHGAPLFFNQREYAVDSKLFSQIHGSRWRSRDFRERKPR